MATKKIIDPKNNANSLFKLSRKGPKKLARLQPQKRLFLAKTTYLSSKHIKRIYQLKVTFKSNKYFGQKTTNKTVVINLKKTLKAKRELNQEKSASEK